MFEQRGRKLILDGGTQLNNKNLIFAKISSFSIFYSIKSPKDGGTPENLEIKQKDCVKERCLDNSV